MDLSAFITSHRNHEMKGKERKRSRIIGGDLWILVMKFSQRV
jgi:hypothetical protein